MPRRCIRSASSVGQAGPESIFGDMVAGESDLSMAPYTAIDYSLSMRMPTSRSLSLVSIASAAASPPLAMLHLLLGLTVWPILLIPVSASLAELRLRGRSKSRLATFITSLASLALGLV
jgi:hypothetical protein